MQTGWLSPPLGGGWEGALIPHYSLLIPHYLYVSSFCFHCLAFR